MDRKGEKMKIGFISLGCSKNLVDTEMLIGLFEKNKYQIVSNPEEAEVIIINTCGFIESAKQEAIDTIFEMLEYKKQKCKYIIVMGCLVQRYKKELEKEIPEVDLFLSIDEYENVWNKIEELLENKSLIEDNKLEYLDRKITTGENFAYLKIAEGCSNRCTYCAIPYIRGPFESRKIEDILEEAEKLAKKGIKELIVIAQDTTKYGTDIYGKPMLAELLERLCKIEGIKWIRFLYSYPESITDELLNVVKENEKICKYFDIPIQHISDSVLKRMNRKSNGESIRNLITKIRNVIPEAVIRTTLIVGFPGETKENFEELYEFVKDYKFDKLGCFAYSKEDGTPAAKLKEQLHYKTKTSRLNKIMSIQKEISKQSLEKNINKDFECLIEGKTFDNKYYIGRTYMDVPDIDGIVYIKNTKPLNIGEFVNIKIINVSDYDLIGEIN